MKTKLQIRFAKKEWTALYEHLFPGDEDEHGAVLLAGISRSQGKLTLHIREVYCAEEKVDYVEGKIGYRALAPRFIHQMITRARDKRLAYLAVHNHFSDREVQFSGIDLQSHELGYPALLDISRGVPVGALVFGRRSMQADLWLPDGNRLDLDHAVVVGATIQRIYPRPQEKLTRSLREHDRQLRMFGEAGQAALSQCRVGVIGLGGVGSIVIEYLARLGVRKYVLVDTDHVEVSNLSRIVGATSSDAACKVSKIAVAHRLILSIRPDAEIEVVEDDVARESTAKLLTTCDFLFLAADSMRARLVFNAMVNQYFIPGVQLGSKIRSDDDGSLLDVMSANRPVRPGQGCLWCSQFIDPNLLAIEAKSDSERKDQAYGVSEPNPSVITLNAISAAHAVNDFLLDYLGLRRDSPVLFEHFHCLDHKRTLVEPRKQSDCPECSVTGLRYGMGDLIALPCIEG